MKTTTDKQVALTKYRSLILATLDYLLEKFTGMIVYDHYDPTREYYEQQQVQAEKYFKLRRLDRLEQQFARLSDHQRRGDPEFEDYLERTTGFKFDVSMLVEPTPSIVFDIEYMEDGDENYEGDTMIVDSRRWSGPKPKHFVESEAIAPDGKRKVVVVQWAQGNHASTYINVNFKEVIGVIYGAMGICPEVKASWKDNQTILIETLKSYDANTKYAQISNFADVIKIEYLEH
jgi:hypothetical protein